ncbi:hypothetical protein GMORB2_7594 [Geosmithia morbida]|uniref:Protein BTN n=1 Tax=Geosmithia morbida TaxID=1094350 RepID=A0A9P4YRX2_9HYPO|nr:uncharacterized protein GMORB2_7594 [Geosmithia morbida]KAF4122001.1 hypothetical protein GMORB2_7594 [Geosmithia morbida]
MPGTPSASWAMYAARAKMILHHPNMRVILAFWLLGLINNVLYVIILSAAQDLVGSLPKGIVLLADVVPSFATKLTAPYFIHRVPYKLRVLACISLSVTGMLMVALTPATDSTAAKMVGVVLASLSSGIGELSFLGLTHYYGQASLAGWGSGTGAAGLVGAGLYVTLTDWWGLSVKDSLLVAATLPGAMFVSFFFVLPWGPLRDAGATAQRQHGYEAVPDDEAIEDGQSPLLGGRDPRTPVAPAGSHSVRANLRRVRALLVPYMMPLFLVFMAEYAINQGVAPTLLFPVDESPFREYRGFYPFYGFLYQLGVFISRSSTPFVRIRHLYVPSLLQVANFVFLILHSLYFFIPSVYLVFAVIFWEGLLGGAVYVNSFAEMLEKVPVEDREFSLSVATVSDSAGICIAGLLGIPLEPWLCAYQVSQGRDWCRRIKAQRG